ncbi:hypothetical protein BVC80_1483g4 [Macleaya cordata]|uniref:Uncharacterized protein n=1 Tax=Macleaya cordata TaxID=56857 RepID=A0A200QNH2_MACCD|nr:hypothetical protein BVC80_1483g4 [Macleaya cordata]
MQSPKSSVGSKSSNGWKDIQFRYHQNDEGIAEVLRTSWIRRLNLRPTSPIGTNKDDPPPIPPPIAVNSPSSTGSGATVLCHRTTISTDESRTQSSIYNARTTPFLNRFLTHHKDKPSLKTDPESCSFSGFGPFQLKNRTTLIDPDKVSGLGNDDHLMHDCLELQEGDGNCEIRDLGQDVRWNLNYTRDSCENDCSRVVEQKEGEEQKRENNSLLHQNWLSINHKTLFTEKVLLSNEGNFKDKKQMDSFPEKRIADDVQRIPHSRFFRYLSASKKHECLRGNRQDQISSTSKCLFGPSEEEKNKIINSNLDSHNMNNPRCSPSWTAIAAGDLRRFEQRLSVDLWPMNRVSHDINYLSRIGSITCHESGAGAGPICRDPHLTRHNAVLRQHERHPPANPNETEEGSSFWNMNSFQRAEMVSSIFRACRSSTKKRNPDCDEFVSVKSRKLGTED